MRNEKFRLQYLWMVFGPCLLLVQAVWGSDHQEPAIALTPAANELVIGGAAIVLGVELVGQPKAHVHIRWELEPPLAVEPPGPLTLTEAAIPAEEHDGTLSKSPMHPPNTAMPAGPITITSPTGKTTLMKSANSPPGKGMASGSYSYTTPAGKTVLLKSHVRPPRASMPKGSISATSQTGKATMIKAQTSPPGAVMPNEPITITSPNGKTTMAKAQVTPPAKGMSSGAISANPSKGQTVLMQSKPNPPETVMPSAPITITSPTKGVMLKSRRRPLRRGMATGSYSVNPTTGKAIMINSRVRPPVEAQPTSVVTFTQNGQNELLLEEEELFEAGLLGDKTTDSDPALFKPKAALSIEVKANTGAAARWAELRGVLTSEDEAFDGLEAGPIRFRLVSAKAVRSRSKSGGTNLMPGH